MGVRPADAPGGAAIRETLDGDADRQAGVAAGAARPIGEMMAAAETGAAEIVVEAARVAPGELGDQLALALLGQIGAGQGRGAVEMLQRRDERPPVGLARPQLRRSYQLAVAPLGHIAQFLPCRPRDYEREGGRRASVMSGIPLAIAPRRRRGSCPRAAAPC